MNIDVFRGNLSMLGGCSLRGCSGPWNTLTWHGQVGVLDGPEVAGGALDAEPEQVTDAADVAPDDWLSLRMRSSRKCLGAQGGVQPRELVADRDESGCRASVDEQVRFGRVGPGTGSVVEPCGQAGADGGGQRDGSAVDDEAAVDDVGEPLHSCLPTRTTTLPTDRHSHRPFVGRRPSCREPQPPADAPLNLSRRRNEPERIEIAGLSSRFHSGRSRVHTPFPHRCHGTQTRALRGCCGSPYKARVPVNATGGVYGDRSAQVPLGDLARRGRTARGSPIWTHCYSRCACTRSST
jgi:hypothetical protein